MGSVFSSCFPQSRFLISVKYIQHESPTVVYCIFWSNVWLYITQSKYERNFLNSTYRRTEEVERKQNPFVNGMSKVLESRWLLHHSRERFFFVLSCFPGHKNEIERIEIPLFYALNVNRVYRCSVFFSCFVFKRKAFEKTPNKTIL